MNNWLLAALVFALILLSNFIFISFQYFFINNRESNLNGNSSNIPAYQILLIIVIAPLLETAIFQSSIIKLSRVFIKNNLIVIVISSFLFGLSHYYNLSYVFRTILIGFFLSLFYTIMHKKRSSAFLRTVLLHSCWNLFTLALSLIFK